MKTVHWSWPERVWDSIEESFASICRKVGGDGAFWTPVVSGFGADLNIDAFVSGEMQKWTRYGVPR